MRTFALRNQLKCVNRKVDNFSPLLFEKKLFQRHMSLIEKFKTLNNFYTQKNCSTNNERKICNQQPHLISKEEYKSLPFLSEKLSNNLRHHDKELHFITKSGTPTVKFETIEAYKRGGRKFSKISARFRIGNKYGDKTFHANYWKPGWSHDITKNSIRSLVFISHGYGEYLGDGYDEVAKLWCDEVGGGSLVFGHDHVGHGRTTAGERVMVNDIRELVDPIIAHVKKVQKWNYCGDGYLPLFLVGHSMGGLLSMFCLIQSKELFKGFVGISPLVSINPKRATPTNKFLAKQLQRYFPRFTLPSFMDNNDDSHITRDKKFVEKIKNDSLRYHGGPKARMGYILIKSCEKLQKNMSMIKTPILILQGKEDKLVEPSGAKLLYQNVSSMDKEYVLYDHAYHNLFVELEDVKKDVHMKTLKWMNERL